MGRFSRERKTKAKPTKRVGSEFHSYFTLYTSLIRTGMLLSSLFGLQTV